MTKASVGALIIAVATQATGCIITSDDSDDFGTITATWQIKNVGGAPAPCPPGYNTAALYSQPVDANGNDIGDATIDLFRCDDGIGVSAPLDPGLYQSWIEITNDNNTARFARSLSAYVDLTFEDKTFDVGIFVDGGYIQVDWNLARASNGKPMLCAEDPDITNIEIQASYGSPTDFFDRPYPCEDYTAITAGLVARTYTVVLQAIDALDQPLSEAETVPEVVVPLYNEVNHLPNPVTLVIDGQ